ncbi:hypothetical protein CDV31_004821 [Fusarium ambrosium]|uniref:GPI inositol-deacylase winged helix domain-containing protein n=1 Tax=Fusarium ambrosium TaxID=131363 RepID=A0A428UNF6_9HYPO|nr:hypothetical protein CDV31_004821 [Fusarium ambrosium]
MTLMWLVCVVRPITISELREALAIKINASCLGSDDFSSTESIVEACKGLATIRKDSVIQLLPHTAREYLGSNFGWLGEPSIRGLAVAEAAERATAIAHRGITLKLLAYLSFDIFESGPCLNRIQYLNRKKPNGLYSYGGCYWGDHLKSSGPYISDIVDLDTSSLLTHLLGSEKKWASCIEPLEDCYSFSTLGLLWGYQDPFTRLHLAAFCGVKPLVTALLGSHQVNAQDASGRDSLSYAAEKGHVDVVMSLLKAGAHVDIVDTDAKTPLAHAAQSGHEEVVRCLVKEKADIERKCTFNWTPLALAVMDGHRTVAELLLEEGADIQARDFLNRTPLALAAKNGQSSAVEYLLRKNANAEARDDDDQTPLLQATRGGHIAAARVLLNWGVDIEARDCGQSMALINAARAGHVSLVKTLFEKGCDVEARTRHGMTALSYAVLTDHEKTKSLRSRNYDSDINELGGAEAEENFEMCQLLLDNKASPNGTGAADWSPLMEAVSLGRADITRFLLRAGADPNLGPPITLAARHDHVEIVRALTIAGADTESLETKTWEFVETEAV